MKKKLSLICFSVAFVTSSLHAQANRALDGIKEELIVLEKKSWEAWKNRDGEFYKHFLSDDHIEIGFGGVDNKSGVIATVSSNHCIVKTYTVGQFQLVMLDETTAVLTYNAAQETICSGKALPSPVWVCSIYKKRNDVWLNAVYQQSQAQR